jgi:hypothetical protein
MREIFFYGLFVDERRVRAAGFTPVAVGPAVLTDYALSIESRATLDSQSGAKSYGVVMGLPDEETTALYSEPSVADYIAEQVTANILETATVRECWCYNLPATRHHTPANSAYRAELSQLLTKLSFPREYVRDVAGE